MSDESTTKRSPFVIFLDIEGVLYNTLDELTSLTKGRTSRTAYVDFLNKEALENLNYLIKEIEKITPVWIVISSSLRRNRSVKDLKTIYFGIHHFSTYIVDKTPEEVPYENMASYCRSEDHSEPYNQQCRAVEIQYWLTQHREVIHFVILDDVDDHLSENFGERFIEIERNYLLTFENSQKILNQLKK